MGTCSSTDFEEQTRRRHIPGHPYQISLVKQADQRYAKHYQTSITRGNSDTTNTSDECTSPNTIRVKTSEAMRRGRNFLLHPNVGPVISKLKGKWDKNFTLEEISIKAKHHSFEENHADDEEVCQMWKDISQQYQKYKWQNAKALKLDFEGCRKITDVSLETIGIELKRNFRGLNTLSLGFAECIGITDNGIETLLKTACPHLPKLRKLELNFTRCYEISDHGLSSIAYNLARFLPGLEYLTLNFTESENVTENGLKQLSTKIPRRLTNLKKLNLICNRCDTITDQHYLKLIGHPYNRLEEINLSFQGCQQICDKSLDDFGSQLSRYKIPLKSLILNYNSCDDVTDEGFENFQFHTKELFLNLQKLSLDLGECRSITNRGIEALGTWMSKYLINLESFTLNLDKCSQFNDKTLEMLGEKLSKMSRLKHLNLTMASNDAVTDKSLQVFGDFIGKNLVMLRSVKLVFANCRSITDSGFEMLGKRIKKLPGLQEYTLNFSRCEKLTNHCLNMVDTAVHKYFCSLRKLSLDFRGCGKVTYDMKDNLKQLWTYNSKLELF